MMAKMNMPCTAQRFLKMLVGYPAMLFCNVLGWLLLMLYGVGGTFLSMVAVLLAGGGIISVLSAEYGTAVFAFVMAVACSPVGLPAIAMRVGATALAAASMISVWVDE